MMVISGDFTSIVAGTTQPKVENRKPQQSGQSSSTQFDDVLNKNKNDNLAAVKDSDKQAEKAESEKKSSDKIVNDKAVNDQALAGKAASGTATGNDQSAANNAQMAAAAENEMSTKEHDGKKEGKLKSSSQEEQNSDDSAAFSINHYLSQLNSSKDSATKEGNLTARSEGDIGEIKTDDNAGDNRSGKQTSGKRVQNSANQTANSTNQQPNFNTASDKLEAAPTLNIGDKVATTGNGTEKSDALGRIADVEVTENRKVGEMRVLRIKLNPESLGMVEARLRKTSDGLQIEIHAERQETARLLAADRHMLGRALEKSGFNDDGRLTIMIVDRSQTVQQGQASNSGQSTPQDNSGQNFNGQRQFSGQQGQGGNNESRQTFTEFPFTGTPLQEESVGQETAYRNPRRLVV